MLGSFLISLGQIEGYIKYSLLQYIQLHTTKGVKTKTSQNLLWLKYPAKI